MIIGIIGLGRLGTALARGLDRAGKFGTVLGYNRSEEKAVKAASLAPSLVLCSSEREILADCDVVFLWTKPADADAVLRDSRDLIREKNPLIVGSVRGVPSAEYAARRAETYPNVNTAVGMGVTPVAFPPDTTASDRAAVLEILNAVGTAYEVPADDLSYIGALTSCGPALYATMTELYADAVAARHGFDRSLCRKMVRETVLGTMALQEADNLDADGLVRRVAHPGGPSEQGVRTLANALPGLYELTLTNMRK